MSPSTQCPPASLSDDDWSCVESPRGATSEIEAALDDDVVPDIEALHHKQRKQVGSTLVDGADDDDFDEEDFDDDFDDDFEDELDEELNDDLDEFDEEMDEEGLDGSGEDGNEEVAEPFEDDAEEF
jgi:hypothetical protein